MPIRFNRNARLDTSQIRDNRGQRSSGTTDATGKALIRDLTQEDTSRAIDAANAERKRWFMTGYQQGSLQACDTFSAQRLYAQNWP